MDVIETLISRGADLDKAETNGACPICGKNYFGLKNQKSRLTRHIKSVHINKLIVPENAIKCPECDKICKSRSGHTKKNSHEMNTSKLRDKSRC